MIFGFLGLAQGWILFVYIGNEAEFLSKNKGQKDRTGDPPSLDKLRRGKLSAEN